MNSCLRRYVRIIILVARQNFIIQIDDFSIVVNRLCYRCRLVSMAWIKGDIFFRQFEARDRFT